MLQVFAIFAMLAILSVLIIVHEFGHFSVARLFGFQTPVFGFGLPFGPYWVVGHRWGTQFRVHACLLGGYVAIPELGDESSVKEENYGVPLKPFRAFPIWQRALVAFAGVGFNILFAYFVMFVMLQTIGQPTQPIVVHALPAENPIAARAGVTVGDRIVSVDTTLVTSPDEVVQYLGHHKNSPVVLHIERKGKPVDISLTTNSAGKVGMALMSKGQVKYRKVEGNFLQIASLSAVKLWNLTLNLLDALGMMLSGLFSGGKASAGHPAVGLEDLHGVLAVIKIGADIAQQDWSQLFLFTIMISLDLAIINLVPWPALDGGHLAFMAFEAVRGRPMGEKAQGEIVKWGFISLLVLMAVIMVNDVRALFTGQLDFKQKSDKVSSPGQKQSLPDTDQKLPSADSAKSTLPAPASENGSQQLPAKDLKLSPQAP